MLLERRVVGDGGVDGHVDLVGQVGDVRETVGKYAGILLGDDAGDVLVPPIEPDLGRTMAARTIAACLNLSSMAAYFPFSTRRSTRRTVTRPSRSWTISV